ncbi:MAG: PAQR family membrane homeostasis protein TrhA, partial [Candidatus Binatia bacterium]
LVLYSASALYHWIPVSSTAEDRFRRFDHVAIFLLIAGSYSPICLVTLRGAWGWSLFAVVWAVALAGSAVKLFLPHVSRWVSVAMYVGMGWLAVIAVVPLVEAFPATGLAWLAAGGLLYTAGAVIYGLERPDPFPQVFGFHEIFHVATLGGSASHFAFMLLYVAPLAT